VIRFHEIPPGDFTALARGGGGPAAVARLGQAQLSRHLLLIRHLVERWPAPRDERDRALAVLGTAQARNPAAVTELLAAASIGAWTAHTVRCLRATSDPAGVRTQLGQLGAIAAAAAIRAELDATVTGYPTDGWLFLPTLGSVRAPVPDGTAVDVSIRDGAVHLRTGRVRLTAVPQPDRDSGNWRPLRRLHADGYHLVVDDLGPYRGGHHVPPASRLDAAQVERWRVRFDQAWSLLRHCAPERVAELSAGLRTIVPLPDAGPGIAMSASIRDAYGAFGLTLPESAAEFAVTLVHEFQHSKLSAILDITGLYEPGEDIYFAPWRTDPRPIGGLFQGVYAFLGVADAWRALGRDPRWRSVAERRFAEVRLQVDEGLRTLTGTGRLTAAGRRFAEGMRESLDGLLAVPLPETVTTAAWDALARTHSAWLARHGSRA
jgi:HEXXH motif-containing protein